MSLPCTIHLSYRKTIIKIQFFSQFEHEAAECGVPAPDCGRHDGARGSDTLANHPPPRRNAR